MSLFQPKDADYIARGLLLLIAWFWVGWLPFAIVGAILAGAGGAAVGLVISIPIGIWGYSAYLNYGLRVITKDVERLEQMIELRRIQLNRITNDPHRIENRKRIAPAFTVPRQHG